MDRLGAALDSGEAVRAEARSQGGGRVAMENPGSGTPGGVLGGGDWLGWTTQASLKKVINDALLVQKFDSGVTSLVQKLGFKGCGCQNPSPHPNRQGSFNPGKSRDTSLLKSTDAASQATTMRQLT